MQPRVTATGRVDASIIKGPQLEPIAVWIKRLFAAALIILSLYGTYVQAAAFGGVGGGEAWIYAIVYQVVFSVAQFALRSQWQSVWYAGALAASVVPSIMTYGPLVTPGLSFVIADFAGHDVAEPMAWIAVGLVVTLLDVVPERILVSR